MQRPRKYASAIFGSWGALLMVVVGGNAQDVASSFVISKDLKIERFADLSQLADPVALCLDEQGRVLVAETGRMGQGVEENRRGDTWLNDDLALKRVENRLEMYHKWADQFSGGLAYFTKHADQVRVLEDTDHDGQADQSTLLEDRFSGPLDGIGSGVLAFRGDLYYACVPNLYRFRDVDGDGRYDKREILHRGFGVRHAFLGHDLHGLVWGPDGKLYFSMGDRGFHVVTHEGVVLDSPDRGAVLRCNRDGSELEIFAFGLRNPQELAFDQFGNLFTGDNNSDAGDASRLVYLPEGSDSGWNMTYQYLDQPYSRGPWTAEHMWHPQRAGQPAWILPPIAWTGGGPSGMVYYPGVGLSHRYDGHFFLCDYHAGSGSCVESFAVESVGAGFKMVDMHQFVQHLNASDVEFGYDGKMYLCEFTGGWNLAGTGRVYTLYSAKHVGSEAVRQITSLFQEGFTHRESQALIGLLGHADMRVRLRAQFALAERGKQSIPELNSIATDSQHRLARLHAIWGLGQIGQSHREALEEVILLLADDDVEIRASAARVLGDNHCRAAAEPLVIQLRDDNLRVRAMAAHALAKLQYAPALQPLLDMLAENADRDVFLRHAGVMGLAGSVDGDTLLAHANHPSRSVRLAILVALRRLRDDRLSCFLHDEDQQIVVEAARAIHDLPLPGALPELAKQIHRYTKPQPIAGMPLEADGPEFEFRREFWHDIPGSKVADLTQHPDFQAGMPDETDIVGSLSNGPERGANYGTRITGILTAPQTGEYTFYLTSDDQGQLWVSKDEDRANLERIASVPTYARRGNWDEFSTQASKKITLTEGGRYFVEVLHKEGGSPDHLAVGWKLPDGTVERPIGGNERDEAGEPDERWHLLRRVLNANFRLGQDEQARALAQFAANPDNLAPLRREALRLLSQWSVPLARDGVLGHLQRLSPRDPERLQQVLQPVFGQLLNNTTGDLRVTATQLASQLGIQVDAESFRAWLLDTTLPVATRVESLRLLDGQDDPDLLQLVDELLGDQDPVIRGEARNVLADLDARRGFESLEAVLKSGHPLEQQLALSTLAALAHDQADQLIAGCIKRLLAGDLPLQLELDVLEAARLRQTPSLTEALGRYEASLSTGDPLADFRWALHGGDPVRGEAVFFGKTETQCQRCHAITGPGGGNTGPDLSGIGLEKNRQYLLESIVAPDRKMAQGYHYVAVLTEEGIQYSGRIVEETSEEIRLQLQPEGEITIPLDTIEEQTPGRSAMPDNLAEKLTPGELRDLIAFLSNQRSPKSGAAPIPGSRDPVAPAGSLPK